MLYIITEDSNSARDFWQCVAQTFRSVDSFLLVSFPIGSDGQTASGNTTLKAQVLGIFPKLQAGDKVFVAVEALSLLLHPIGALRICTFPMTKS